MSAVADTLPMRVSRLEWRAEQMVSHESRIKEGEEIDVNHEAQLLELRTAVNKANEQLVKIYWVLCGLCITIATSSIGLALQQFFAARGKS